MVPTAGKPNRARTASEVDREIGRRIRARRDERAMSQEMLAAKIGVTFQQVQKYEKGVNRVAASTLIEIARALDAPASDLLPQPEGGERNPDGRAASEFDELVGRLNADGKRVLAGLAKSLAEDEKLSAPRAKRSPR